MVRAAFLDRDGVVIDDVGIVTTAAQMRLCDGAAEATALLAQAGFALFVATNQTAMARGLLAPADLDALHRTLQAMLSASGGANIQQFYTCPHHPHAQIEAYRRHCACRKPMPGLLLQAAAEHGLSLTHSVLFGDRPSDIACARRAGCEKAFLVASGVRAPIVGGEGLSADETLADGVSSSLFEAVRLFLGEGR